MTSSTLQPDYLAAEARRWVGGCGPGTSPAILRRALRALGRYYADVAVLAGIVAAKCPPARKPAGEPPERPPCPHCDTPFHRRRLIPDGAGGWSCFSGCGYHEPAGKAGRAARRP